MTRLLPKQTTSITLTTQEKVFLMQEAGHMMASCQGAQNMYFKSIGAMRVVGRPARGQTHGTVQVFTQSLSEEMRVKLAEHTLDVIRKQREISRG